MKEVINLNYVGTTYKVTSLTNRLEPKVGTYLDEEEVKKLLNEAKDAARSAHRPQLTVNIK